MGPGIPVDTNRQRRGEILAGLAGVADENGGGEAAVSEPAEASATA